MVIFITGAARGIGAASARKLAGQGHQLALVDLQGDAVRETAAACGPETLAVEADITDPASLDAAVARTVERFGGIDVVLANAGIATMGPFSTMDAAVYDRVLDVNLMGVVRTVRACLPHVLERRGYVLMVASVAAINPAFPYGTNYAAAKAGVEAFGTGLRLELAHHGVDVGVAYFSWIGSDMVNGADEHPAFRMFRSRLRGPFGKTYPVEVAADVVADGIARRRRNVCGPRWVRALLPLRAMLPGLTEREARSVVVEGERLFAESGDAVAGPGARAALAEKERASV
jgi:NAD(P)-dependent dehydrogenase (short-subunit alcohol dehydrogenase family)